MRLALVIVTYNAHWVSRLFTVVMGTGLLVLLQRCVSTHDECHAPPTFGDLHSSDSLVHSVQRCNFSIPVGVIPQYFTAVRQPHSRSETSRMN